MLHHPGRPVTKCEHRHDPPFDGMLCDPDGWHEVMLPDGRRGLWEREGKCGGCDAPTVEYCAGREGDDAYVRLVVGELVTGDLLAALGDVMATAGWAVEMAEEDRKAVNDCPACTELRGQAEEEYPLRCPKHAGAGTS